MVDGVTVTEMGVRADAERQIITVDGRRLTPPAQPLYLALHKPAGYVTTRSDPHAMQTVMDLVRREYRPEWGPIEPALAALHPVGRLDTMTEGLLLLTNDGDFTQRLTHPSHAVPKTYHALVLGVPGTEDLRRLRAGVSLNGRRTARARVRLLRAAPKANRATVEVVLREGRNRQVRRMLEALGHPVIQLRRVQVGAVRLRGLRLGKLRRLSESEIAALLKPPRPRRGESSRRQ